jgi:hypothetical protein
MKMELGFVPAEDEGERTIQRLSAWEAPRLPGIKRASMRRWIGGPTWVPHTSQPLVRHRSLDGSRRVVSNDRTPPNDFVIEYDLGLTHAFAQPGTQRLITAEPDESGDPMGLTVQTGQRYFRTPFEGILDSGYTGLGYIEEAPLPMLDALELRRDLITGDEVLVAGADDPLYDTAEPLATLGFVESYPIQPRHPPGQPIDWGLITLQRSTDPVRWRHRYSVSDKPVPETVSLGGLWTRPGSSLIPLHLCADGTLTSELLPTARLVSPSLGASLRWAAAPLGWPEGRPRAWAARATASRLSRLRAERLQASPAASSRVLLGYLRHEPSPGWGPLFSAVHPALPDQYVTRSELEATDMGYRVEGVLGYVLDRCADRSRDALPAEVKWGSRFGQRRRYVEGLRR